MNKGISLSKGEWLYFLGADDKLFDENTLSNLSLFNVNKDISIIAGKVTYYGNGKPFVYSKSKKIKNSSWSRSIWIRNSIHHQAAFYRKEIFENRKYNLKYKVLADYDLNIKLYKENLICKLIETTIAKCSDGGTSKNGGWPIYKEEILIKINNSSQFYYPFFFLIAIIKYLLRKFTNV